LNSRTAQILKPQSDFMEMRSSKRNFLIAIPARRPESQQFTCHGKDFANSQRKLKQWSGDSDRGAAGQGNEIKKLAR
jgi:hypothetical protein